jgi:hypothetical protein
VVNPGASERKAVPVSYKTPVVFSNVNVSLTFYMVVMTIWLPLRNVHISNDNVPITFYVYIFFPLSLPLTFTGLTFDMNNTTGVL